MSGSLAEEVAQAVRNGHRLTSQPNGPNLGDPGKGVQGHPPGKSREVPGSPASAQQAPAYVPTSACGASTDRAPDRASE